MEKFNPSDPKYKKVADLPVEEQSNFADVEDGFVRKEANKPALRAQILEILNNDNGAYAKEIEKIRDEAIDINQSREEILSTLKSYNEEYAKKPGWQGAEKTDRLHRALLDIKTSFSTDRALVLEAIKTSPEFFYKVSENFNDDEEIISEVIRRPHNSSWFKLASERLKSDLIFISDGIKKGIFSGDILQYASTEVKDNKDVFLIAARKYCGYAEYASEKLKNDENFIFELIRSAGERGFQFASDRLKNNQDFVLKLVKDYPGILEFISEALNNNQKFILKVVMEGPLNILNLIPSRYCIDLNFLLEVAKKRPVLFAHIKAFEGDNCASIRQTLGL